nr:MAG TPA: hypothetical protein [Caudoviricetes sp.]
MYKKLLLFSHEIYYIKIRPLPDLIGGFVRFICHSINICAFDSVKQ